ncbi:2-hydroxyacid dehydrogenase [Gaetbulibacter aestuarii]|uniref:2-hydroxyacid dehydrogenase n=1 Tax=Gaetbulibacter aestuarii TaxID=1502358 RepID=A0ABW7MXV4_9FLAO
MKVLVYSTKKFEIPYLKAANNGKHNLTFLEESLSSETAMKAIGFKAVSLFTSDNASNIVIEKLKDFGVKYITLRSVGHDNVNLFAAQKNNIQVAFVPAYSPHAVAEHAAAILLALNRKLIQANKRVKAFNFDLDDLIGTDLNNKTCGIIGTGKIGSVMAKIMHGFGCKLLGHDTHPNKHLSVQYQMKYVPLKTLCEHADIISIHVPLNTETHHLIDASLLNIMKPHCLLVNTARGAILNTKDVVEALIKKQIQGLAMDVYEFERGVFFKDCSKAIPNDDLLIKLNAMPNVIITGHQAFLTDEALKRIAETTIENLDSWDKGKKPKNELHFKLPQTQKV